MSETNLHQAMWDYLTRYPALDNYLKFNTVSDTPDEICFVSSYGGVWEKKQLRGHGVKRYDFAIVIIKTHDSGTTQSNEQQIFDVEKFMQWIDEQNSLSKFPDFGTNIKILSIENLQNMPTLAGTDDSGTAAKYMFQCRVRYYV